MMDPYNVSFFLSINSIMLGLVTINGVENDIILREIAHALAENDG